ncbi:MAG TPA: hypothetical protein VLE48_08760 [Terriglobales bacterium]|nr:hypothetical protein [Terriglobales bacterium]
MTCKELQEVLGETLEGQPGAEQQAHLDGCAACTVLLQDLRLIREQAAQLPLAEPNPRVWMGIREALEKEGLITDAAPAQVLRPDWSLPRFLWSPAWQVGTMAAALAVVCGMIISDAVYPKQAMPDETQALVQPLPEEDANLLQAMEARAPGLRPAYEESLRGANAYIADAQQSLSENPTDARAREMLMRAYQQKAAIYEMAMSHSAEPIR